MFLPTSWQGTGPDAGEDDRRLLVRALMVTDLSPAPESDEPLICPLPFGSGRFFGVRSRTAARPRHAAGRGGRSLGPHPGGGRRRRVTGPRAPVQPDDMAVARVARLGTHRIESGLQRSMLATPSNAVSSRR